jgi:dTDP-3-amino-2,3,6-trideoxy-4-keto-D-glucose/dTDP-3-amino-3,4,6-trideoxy-alpha-D-glucose/dTDP-2,6-dideoxy-D-kanosamine transaminase
MTAAQETRVPINDLSRGALGLRAELSAAFERFLESGRYVHGPEHAALESEFAAYLGVRHCIGVASGTDALQLALLAVGCEPGDEILTTANSGGYTAAAARRIACRPSFADVDPATLSLSVSTVEPALTAATRAVVVTHLYGLVGDVESIAALCRERGIAVVEDCAQSAGARRNGRRAGGSGDVSAFSFYPTKNLAALGDGGAVVTASEEIADRVRRLRQYGWDRKYDVTLSGGWNSRLDEFQAAVLRIRLPHLDAWNARRREIVRRYAEVLAPEAGRFVAHDGEDYVAHLAVVLAEHRERLRASLDRAGIGTDVHYPTADHRQPAWAGQYAGLSLPVTEYAVEHVLTLPCFPELTDEEVERVCEVLSGF